MIKAYAHCWGCNQRVTLWPNEKWHYHDGLFWHKECLREHRVTMRRIKSGIMRAARRNMSNEHVAIVAKTLGVKTRRSKHE